MNAKRWVMPLAAGCALALLGGCNRSGQTGSPDDQPPSYQTSDRFSPPDSGGSQTGGPERSAGNRSTFYPQGGDRIVLLPGGYVVTAADNRGVLVYDVSEPSKPRLVGELPLRGYVFQLESDGDDAAPSIAGGAAPALRGGASITLVILETLSFDEPRVPETPPASSALRLVHVDLSDPTAPTRGAQIDLQGDVWEFVRRGQHYYVLSELYEPSELVCGQSSLVDEWGPNTRAMQVSDYELAADGFALRGSLELPADASFAFATDDGYFVPNGSYSDPAKGLGNTLSWADCGDAGLVEGGSVALEGRLVAVARKDAVLATLVEVDRNSTLLQTFALDAQGMPSARGTLALGSAQAVIELLPGAQRLLVGGGVAQLVDLSDLAHPSVIQDFPADAQRLISVPDGLLALGGSDTGHLVASLWALPEQDSPHMLGRFASPWPWPNVIDPGYEAYRVDAERGLLLAPFSVGNAGAQPALGVAHFDAGGVASYGHYALHKDAFRPISDGVNAYSWSTDGLEVVPLEQGAMQSEPAGGFAAFHEPKVLASATVAGHELSLSERAKDGRYVLSVSGGGDPTEIVLDHRSEGLIAAGDRVVVLGVRWDSECQFLSDLNPDPDNAAFDPCAPYRRRGITVVDLHDEPKVVASFAISADMDVEPIDGVSAETEWSGYVELPDGRLAFPVQRELRCSSQTSCDALGVPAYESMATPGCNPQAQDCAALPKVEILTDGAKPSLLLYVLDDVASDPKLSLGVEVEGRFELPGEGPLDVNWQLLPNADDIAFARAEPIYDANGNSVVNAHEDAIVKFYLDRIAIDADGSLHALPSVNTPGRPVAWHGKQLYTVEPAYNAKGDVVVNMHRSLLRDDFAYIEASIELGAGFLDARAVGDQLVVLRGPADPCAEDPRTDLFTVALDPDAMTKSAAIDLPGRAWGFLYGPTTDADGDVLVRGGPLPDAGRLEVDISAKRPSVVRYATGPSP